MFEFGSDGLPDPFGADICAALWSRPFGHIRSAPLGPSEPKVLVFLFNRAHSAGPGSKLIDMEKQRTPQSNIPFASVANVANIGEAGASGQTNK